MADLSFDIEVTGIKELRDAAANFERLGKVSSKLAAQYKPLGAQTNRLIKEQKRLEAVEKSLAKAVDQKRIDIVQANRAMEEEIRVSRERILTDKNLIAAQRKRAKGEERARRETERLTKAYAPARMAADLFQKKLKEIDRAAKAGIISQNEAALAARSLTKEFRDFTSGVATGGNQFAKFNVETYKFHQTIKRRLNTTVQQAGFQFQDFFVQIQSGTNIAVAFGQQMSQLLGIFGAGGAVAGAGVAIGTAIIAPIIRARKEAKGLDQDIGAVFSTLKDNQQTSADIIQLSFTGPLEESRKLALETLNIIDEINRKDAQNQIAEGAKGLLKELDKLRKDAVREAGQGLISQFGIGDAATQRERDAAAALIRDIDAAYIGLGRAATGDLDGLTTKLLESLTYLEESGLASDKLTKDFAKLVKDSGLLADETKRLVDADEKRTEARNKLNRITTDAMVLEAELMEEIAAEERKRGDLYLAIRRHVIDLITKAEQEAAAKLQKLDNFRAKVYSKDRREAIASIYEAERAEILRTADLQRFITTSRNQARVQMLRTISDAEKAFADEQAKKAEKEAEAQQKIFQKVEDYITGLSNEYKKMVQLRDVSKDQLDLQSALIDAKQKYGSKATKVQMDVIEATLRLIDVEKQHQQVLEEAQKTQERVSESLGSSLESAMMSIVDGTASVKDAFREMAAAVIKDLYRILVVEQLVASFKVATGPFAAAMGGLNANGNAFSGGQRITAYANGGVVGGPSYFPMSGNRVGLMGEAGPEAIMPLSRGKDGKLGVQASGQAVTVNQNISISTGVQQTVRTEIKSLMPQIAEASKAAVADAKRRGGSYGRTFS